MDLWIVFIECMAIVIIVLVSGLLLLYIIDQTYNIVNNNENCYFCWGSQNCKNCCFCIKCYYCKYCYYCTDLKYYNYRREK